MGKDYENADNTGFGKKLYTQIKADQDKLLSLSPKI